MKYIAFDVETTGFIAGIDQIVEISAIRFVDGKADGLFSTLVDPCIPIPQSATNVSGIRDDMVQGKPTIDKLLEPFAEFCGSDLLVAHNASFDYQFVTESIRKFESSAPKGLILDSCSISRKVFPGLLNYKLGTLVQHLKFKTEGLHRAEADAFYCGQLFAAILNKVFMANEPLSIEKLIALSNNQALKFPQVIRAEKQLNFFDSLSI